MNKVISSCGVTLLIGLFACGCQSESAGKASESVPEKAVVSPAEITHAPNAPAAASATVVLHPAPVSSPVKNDAKKVDAVPSSPKAAPSLKPEKVPDEGKPSGTASTTNVPAPEKAKEKDNSEQTVKPSASADVPKKTDDKSSAPASSEKKTHVVQYDESLWIIAVREYGNGNKWDVIFEANRAILKTDPNNIRPGMKLKIPALK